MLPCHVPLFTCPKLYLTSTQVRNELTGDAHLESGLWDLLGVPPT